MNFRDILKIFKPKKEQEVSFEVEPIFSRKCLGGGSHGAAPKDQRIQDAMTRFNVMGRLIAPELERGSARIEYKLKLIMLWDGLKEGELKDMLAVELAESQGLSKYVSELHEKIKDLEDGVLGYREKKKEVFH